MTHGAKNDGSFSEMKGPILTSDYVVTPVLTCLGGHLKKKTNYRLMQSKVLQNAPRGPSLSQHLLLRFLFCLILSGC